jgi:Flp pilus assembly protein TadG
MNSFYKNGVSETSLGSGMKRRSRKRSHRGAVSFMEIAMGSFLLLICVFFGLDAYVWMQAYMINDMACRDAARAAAAAQPQTSTTTLAAWQQAATDAANAQLRLHINNGPYISNPQLVNINWNDYNQVYPPPPQTPNVTVTTSIDFNLPAPIFFMGNMVMQGGGGQKLTFRRTYVFPIINLRPQ